MGSAEWVHGGAGGAESVGDGAVCVVWVGCVAEWAGEGRASGGERRARDGVGGVVGGGARGEWARSGGRGGAGVCGKCDDA